MPLSSALTYMETEELLASRGDLSTFLVHLTRSSSICSAKELLTKILEDQKLIAGNSYGMAARKLELKGIDASSQKVVCFTETPMEHLTVLTSEIEGRSCKFEPYGIAITRKQGRARGVNPVWYIDITPGHDWMTNPINRLIDDAISSGNFDASDISKIAPFFEQMGTSAGDPPYTSGYRKEFWWEREWRHKGDFSLPNNYMVLCPAEEAKEFKEVLEGLDELQKPTKFSFVDPSWSLERIIGKLAGFKSSELGPF
jgi:hypothetical protein